MTTSTESGGREGMTRRRATGRLLAAAAAAPLPIALAGRASAAPSPGSASPRSASPRKPSPRGPLRPKLPAPTGPYPVGTVTLHLVDPQRPDPVAGPGRHRELMASLWYPARDVRHHPRAHWIREAPLRGLLAQSGFDPDIAVAPLTSGHEGAPVRRTGGRRHPVVLFSHEAHDHRADTTVIVQELASHGYVVVTVDHTYDAFTQFPDGRLSVPLLDIEHALLPRDFAADLRFVLDRVEELDAGHDPDAGRRTLPVGLRGAFDLDRVGVFGASKGGTAAALVMLADPRVRAGLSLDGPMQPLFTTDLDRPFLLLTAEFTRAAEPSVAQFWSHLRGWRLNLQADGAVHTSYSDYQVLLPQLAAAAGLSDADLLDLVGTLPAPRAARIQQAYPLAFFDLHLRHDRSAAHLLSAPGPAFPEVRFLP